MFVWEVLPLSVQPINGVSVQFVCFIVNIFIIDPKWGREQFPPVARFASGVHFSLLKSLLACNTYIVIMESRYRVYRVD